MDFAAAPYGIWGLVLILLAFIWTLPWKGVALWRAARNSHRWWFITLLVTNTLAVLEIIYIFAFSRREEAAAPSR